MQSTFSTGSLSEQEPFVPLPFGMAIVSDMDIDRSALEASDDEQHIAKRSLSSSARPSCDESEDAIIEKIKKHNDRRERNREAQRALRERRSQHLSSLQQEAEDLHRTVEKLQQENKELEAKLRMVGSL
jgi:chromosome segregation ATPase